MHIEGESVGEAWKALARAAVCTRGARVCPAVVTIEFTDGDELEQADPWMEYALQSEELTSAETVANTIFPASVWRLAEPDRQRFFDLYIENLPRIRSSEPQLNRGGLYFERLVNWGDGPCNGNQLEFIVSQHRNGRRHSAYQASIFDPARDHSRVARQGFPCLQHVSFLPHDGKVSMNAFYATQLIFQKAFGNYLGLARLGKFMAGEMGMELGRLTCYVGEAKLGVNKSNRALRHILGMPS